MVKVVLSKEQRAILTELARRLGAIVSEMLLMALIDYVKELSTDEGTLHRGEN